MLIQVFLGSRRKTFQGGLPNLRLIYLRKTSSHSVIDRPRPQDTDAAGVPIPMNAAQRRVYEQQCSDYDKMDDIAYSELMKACRRNPRTKHLSETGGFKTAHALLARLRQRFFNVDEVVMLQYYNLKQQESESGADFVDREAREFNSLRGMGVNVDDSMRLTKFIQLYSLIIIIYCVLLKDRRVTLLDYFLIILLRKKEN
jgi:hypothetical protein